MNQLVSKLSLKEKMGYGFGDAASSMFWKMFTVYMTFFYTDIFGIPAAAVGTMFLLTRIWDTVNDPLMGIIADRTNTRWGKFRPYLLWIAFPFGIIGVLTFTTPDFDVSGKTAYAYITYTLMMMVYTAINVPYSSLMGVMTPDTKERTSLASYRFIFAFGGSILVLAIFQPLADFFGNKQLAEYDKAVKKTGIIETETGSSQKTYVWDVGDETAPIEKPLIDSLVVLNLETKTASGVPFQIGLYNQSTGASYGFTFDRDKDTLNMKRDGNWYKVKMSLQNHLGIRGISDMAKWKLYLLADDPEKIEVRNISIREEQPRVGWQLGMVVIASLAILFFILTFSWTRERVKPPRYQERSLKDDIKDLGTNLPWFILLGAGVSTLIFNSIRDGSALYYFKYYISDKEAFFIPLIKTSITYSTLYIVLGQAFNLIGVILAKPVSDRLGKKNTFFNAMVFAAILSFVFYVFTPDHVWLIFAVQGLISISAGIIFPLLWSMYADIADYSEWNTGRRATGLIFSSSSMSQKLGWTMGGAVTGWLLAFFGFEANVEQTVEAQKGIKMMMSFIPGIGALLSAGFIYFYKLSDTMMESVETDLKKRREGD